MLEADEERGDVGSAGAPSKSSTTSGDAPSAPPAEARLWIPGVDISVPAASFRPAGVTDRSPLWRVPGGWVAHDGPALSHLLARPVPGTTALASLLVTAIPEPSDRCEATLGAVFGVLLPPGGTVSRRTLGGLNIVLIERTPPEGGGDSLRRSAIISGGERCVGVSFGCPREAQSPCLEEAERALASIALATPPREGREPVTEADTLQGTHRPRPSGQPDEQGPITCPGPCSWQLDIGLDGVMDGRGAFTYHDDGRISERRVASRGDSELEVTDRFVYDARTKELTSIDSYLGGRLQLKLPQRGVYSPELLYTGGDDVEPFNRVALPGVSGDVETSSSCEHADEGGYGCGWSVCDIVTGPDDKVLRRTRFTCERGVRTKVHVEDGAGEVLALMHYAYDCWPPERGCPTTAPLPESAPPPPPPIKARHEDLIALVRLLDGRGQPLARVIPFERSGKVAGFRVSSIRRQSPLAQMGLKNGDAVISINGTSVISPIGLGPLEVELTAATEATIEVVRREAPMLLSVELLESSD